MPAPRGRPAVRTTVAPVSAVPLPVTGFLAGALVVLLAGVLAGCGLGARPEPPDPPLPPPAPVVGGTDTPTDQLARAAVAGIEVFWQKRFRAEFGRPWRNIAGYYAIDPKDSATRMPCPRQPADVAGKAVYCPRPDVIAWDRVGLLPRLRAEYGDGAVLVALAHEVGHAVQERLGITLEMQPRQPGQYPSILVESMADCFAGVLVRVGVDGGLPGITVTAADRDRALAGLLTFRDPVGLAGGADAHGDAFDRASAFVDGYRRGPRVCAGMAADSGRFTQRGWTSLSDAMNGGNLPLTELLASMVPDTRVWFSQLVTTRGRPWHPPDLVVAPGAPTAGCPSDGFGGQGAVRFCPSDGALSASRAELAVVHHARGDYAGGTLVASRYALAAVGALGRPVAGPDAGRAAVCLTGAYTRALFDQHSSGGFGLSPGDLDEAVDELLKQDVAARDAGGHAPAGDSGFDRIAQFRDGALGGPAGCGF